MTSNEKMRRALEKIAGEFEWRTSRSSLEMLCRWCGESCPNHQLDCPAVIARKALKEQDDE